MLALPLVSNGEKLYLRDGSILNGTIGALTADSVSITTSFGRTFSFARKEIIRIDFSDSAAVAPASGLIAPAAAEPGSLLVLFDSQELSSKIIVQRERDLALSLDANSIEELLYIDNEIVFSYVDTTTDKKIRNGAETIYKNTIELRNIRVALPSGPHVMRLIVGSRGRNAHKDRFENDPLLETLERNNLIIYPGKTTRLVIEAKKKRWGMGGTELMIRE